MFLRLPATPRAAIQGLFVLAFRPTQPNLPGQGLCLLVSRPSVAIRRNFARWWLSSFRLRDPIAVRALANPDGLLLRMSDRDRLAADSGS